MLIALIALAAGAGEWVLYEGDASDQVLEAVRPLAGEAELTVSTIGGVVEGRAPVVRGVATLTECTADALAASELSVAIKKADSALLYQDDAAARQTAQAVIDRLACLDEPVDRHALVRLHVLAGLASFRMGETAKARASFQAAQAIDPDVHWDDAYGADASALMEEVRVEVAAKTPVILEVIPGGRARVDGEPVEGASEILPGMHLLQVNETDGVRSYRVELPETPQVTIVAPAALTPEVTALVEDEGQRRSLSLALTGVVDRGERLYVVHGGHIWRGEPYRNQWERLAAFEPSPREPGVETPPDPVDPVPPAGASRAGTPRGAFTVPMAVVGGGLAVYGLGSASSNMARARQLQADAEAAVAAGDGPGAVEANNAIKQHNANILLGDGLAVAGLGLTATAVYLSVRRGKGTVVVPGAVAGRW